MSRKYIFFILIVGLVGMMFIFLINQHPEKTEASADPDMYNQLNSMALSAKSGQQADVEALVDTIFNESLISRLDPNLVRSLKDRIVRAQMAGQTVSESQVVQGYNWLMGQFSAPTYAQTSVLQVKRLRISSNKAMPNLFVDTDTIGNIGLSKPQNSQMSTQMKPAESVTLLLLMTTQKTINQDFQKEPAQWDSDFYADQQAGNSNQANNGTPSHELRGIVPSQRSAELRQLFFETSYTDANVENMAQGALDQLGIPR